MNFINECAKNVFQDDFYDINRRARTPINWNKVDVIEAVRKMDAAAIPLSAQLINVEGNNLFASKIADSIYLSCKSSYIQRPKLNVIINSRNLKADNYKAIANINLYTYQRKIDENVPLENCLVYLENYKKYEDLAITSEKEEYNTKQNKRWKKLKKDGKKLW